MKITKDRLTWQELHRLKKLIEGKEGSVDIKDVVTVDKVSLASSELKANQEIEFNVEVTIVEYKGGEPIPYLREIVQRFLKCFHNTEPSK